MRDTILFEEYDTQNVGHDWAPIVGCHMQGGLGLVEGAREDFRFTYILGRNIPQAMGRRILAFLWSFGPINV